MRRAAELLARWPRSWRDVIDAWRAEGPDALWLLYSANYLLRTAGVRWAIDPVTLSNRLPQASRPDARDLGALDLILLTHKHEDHIDRDLLTSLARQARIQWLIPRHMLPTAESCGVPLAQIIVPQPGTPLRFGRLSITLFEGLHWEYPSGKWREGKTVAGVDSAACLAEWGGKRVFFPGDTRTYDPAALPLHGPIDTFVSHLWFGRGAALQAHPPHIEAMRRFIVHYAPTRRVLLTHLWEVSRVIEDYWDQSHAQRMQALLARDLPGVETLIPDFWKELTL